MAAVAQFRSAAERHLNRFASNFASELWRAPSGGCAVEGLLWDHSGGCCGMDAFGYFSLLYHFTLVDMLWKGYSALHWASKTEPSGSKLPNITMKATC